MKTRIILGTLCLMLGFTLAACMSTAAYDQTQGQLIAATQAAGVQSDLLTKALAARDAALAQLAAQRAAVATSPSAPPPDPALIKSISDLTAQVSGITGTLTATTQSISTLQGKLDKSNTAAVNGASVANTVAAIAPVIPPPYGELIGAVAAAVGTYFLGHMHGTSSGTATAVTAQNGSLQTALATARAVIDQLPVPVDSTKT